ncbi:MAG: FAD-binding oxidoreductase [Rhodobacteraceae bacterium]|nr:FAD-binding oxidoreductase [Paracoccaceae bacterium]
MERQSAEVAVIGAGVIGLSVALRLAAEGREVVVIDPEPPGSGASYGNAGVVADYAVLPVGTPAVLASLPRLMFDRTSPLALRGAAIPALAPWLLRFLRQSLPAPARRNAAALAGLLGPAVAAWEAMAEEVGGTDLLRPSGSLYAYESAASMQATARELAWRRDLGVAIEMLGPAEAAALEPRLPPLAGAAHFPQTRALADPGLMLSLVAEAAAERGATFLRAGAERLVRSAGGVTVEGTGLRLHARRAVVAAGAHARSLARSAGDRIPLETERGYHLEWDMAVPPLGRPVCPVARGFYLCPMAGRLRAAGTVELGGLSAPPSPHRLALIERGARAIFPDLPAPARSWMGFRPSLPDSLPAVGPSRGGAEVIHAFGHGHIGMTLAPLTAEAVADMVADRPPRPEFGPCAPARFG